MNRIFLLLTLKPVFLGLIGIIISGISFPLAGVIILRNGLIPMRYMLMHGVILGGILSVCFDLPLLVTVIPLNIILVFIMVFLNKRGHELSGASSVMMVCTMGFASLLGHIFDVPAKDTLELLWGSPFALTNSDLIILISLCVLISVYVVLCFRPVSMVFFDSDVASSMGVNVLFHKTVMVFFTALIVSVAMKLLGALLIDALVILPVVMVSKRATSLKSLFWRSSLSGFVLSSAGYFVSLLFNLPVSGVIAVLTAISFVCSVAYEKIGKKNVFVLFVLILSAVLCFFQTAGKNSGRKKYVASTSWVASIAELAGIDDVVSIAPANLKHPPEYEITPDDVYTISNADLFMQAGYERMMHTLGNATGLDREKIIKVKTTNTLENLRNMVKMLSAQAGTEKEAQKRFENYKKMILDARERISNSSNSSIPVYVNKDQAEFVKDLGLNAVSVFGGGQLTADQLAQAAEKQYPLVIDNVHNPQAAAIAEVSPDSKVLVFRNFSDSVGNNALTNVIRDNLEQLWATGLF